MAWGIGMVNQEDLVLFGRIAEFGYEECTQYGGLDIILQMPFSLYAESKRFVFNHNKIIVCTIVPPISPPKKCPKNKLKKP